VVGLDCYRSLRLARVQTSGHTAIAIRQPSASVVHSELVGRESEVRALRGALDRARAAEPQIVLLDGEAGSGKTFLLRTAFDGIGCPVFWGNTSEFASSEFGPVKDMMRRLAREDATRFAAVREAHPIMAVLLDDETSGVARSMKPEMYFQAIAQMLLALGGDGPAVIVLDDLHVADHATVELLDHAQSLMGSERLLLLLAHRSDDLARQHPLRRLRQQWLRRRTGVTALSLPPLGTEETLALATLRLGATPSEPLSGEILRLSGGIPLYVEELVSALIERGGVRHGADGKASASGISLAVPESFREAVLVRMAVLDPQTQRSLERAAVVGPEVDLDMLAAAVGDAAAVARLTEAHWLVDTEPGRARFRHALLREAVYGQIPWTRRRQWHADWAAALEAAGSHGSTAEHWLAAHEYERARQAFLKNAKRAGELHAHADALVFISRALELWREGVDEAGRLDALYRLANHAQFAQRSDEATRAWNEVCERAERAADWGRVGEARRRLAVLWAMAGEVERSIEEREAAAAAFMQVDRRRDTALELCAAADLLNLIAKWRAVLEVVERAWPLALETGALELQVLLQSQRGRATARMGRIDEGLADARAAVDFAEANGLAAVVGSAYQRLADCHEHGSDYGSARDIFMKAAERCALEGSPMQREACRACALAVLLQTGEWPLALRIADEVVADPASPAWARAFGIGIGGVIQAMRGEFRSARPRLRDGLRSARAVGFRSIEHALLRSLALCEWYERKPALALEHARSALRVWSQGEEVHHIVPTACILASLFASHDDAEGVAQCVRAASTAAQATGQAEALAGLAFTMGESQLVAGAAAEAAREFARALELAEGLPLPFWRACTVRRLGEAKARQTNTGSAIQHLRAAIDLFHSLGATPFVQEATKRLAGLAPDALSAADERRQHGGLTPRQRQILAHVARGGTDKEIARILRLSPRTIEMHVSRLMATLRCRTRSEAVARALEMRLLERD
jgi:DNA-binding CsgD family transcriptional regulator/tetratricopeptide (TPR) repeat protein